MAWVQCNMNINVFIYSYMQINQQLCVYITNASVLFDDYYFNVEYLHTHAN